MILEHELPQGSKLYFGKAAKLKRDIESQAVQILYENDFYEIATPTFSYLSHQHDFSNRDMIRLSSKDNHQIVLRYDSTIDVTRIITRRIARSTSHKKWFYIQPVYDYPTKEVNQIGAEHLDCVSLAPVMCLSAMIISTFGLSPMLQICNQKIPLLCAAELNTDISEFSAPDIENLCKKASFLLQLIRINSKNDLQDFLKTAPSFLKTELQNLLDCADVCEYERTIFSPLFYAPGNYYEDLFYRVLDGNYALAIGGRYVINDTHSCGFAIYTDNVVKNLMKKGK